MGGTREALIIATGSYADPELRRLRSPAQDAESLSKVLSDPRIGAFTVQQMIDQPHHVLARRMEQFFSDRSLDDLLLLHLSCHGIKDADGRLYFAATDTEKDLLRASALSAAFLNDLISDCRARAIVLLLDCCYSGAFMPGYKGDRTVHLEDEFKSRGRAILTASNDIEYAWEGHELVGEGRPSVFTDAVVQGLETGEADRDQDGFVSINELHEYVYERVLKEKEKHRQTPLLYSVYIRTDLYVALNPRRGSSTGSPLRAGLQKLMVHPDPSKRLAAVWDLGKLLSGRDASLREASQRALEHLAQDDSPVVSAAARAALGREPEPPPPEPQPPPPPPERPIPAWWRRRLALSITVAAALVGLLVLGVVIARLAGPPGGPTTQSSSGTVSVVSVPATVHWLDTKQDVSEGQRVRIEATGQVTHAVGSPQVGPDGDPRPELRQFNLLPSTNHAALIAKIGDQGQPFLVGSSLNTVAYTTGRLYLGVNDAGLGNNSGSFNVRIELGKP
jgi:Caspase domain